jgi:hypothetical protein
MVLLRKLFWIILVLVSVGRATSEAQENKTPSAVKALPPLVATSTSVSDTLTFGTNKIHGGTVTNLEWDHFLKRVITPLFPEGLTTWEAKGQWKAKDDSITHEKSHLLWLIHPDSVQANGNIQKIIDLYKRQFDQRSVMLVRQKVLVSF